MKIPLELSDLVVTNMSRDRMTRSPSVLLHEVIVNAG